MRTTRIVAQLVILLGLGYAATASQDVAVSPQYDTTHVYVAPEEFDRFVASLITTFGGTATKQGVFTVTPTPSSTMSQLVLTPVGSISVFGFKTPIPYPFGLERTGYLVSDMDEAVREAKATGARSMIHVDVEAEGIGVEGLGPVDVGDRHHQCLELPVHEASSDCALWLCGARE